MAELWTCPSCRRRFANRNQWHSCLELALDEHLREKSATAVDLYRAIEAVLAECGDFRIHPQKTRVSFIARMTFAGVKLATRWVDLWFITRRAVTDDRIRSIEMYGPTSFGHTLRIARLDEVDGSVAIWLCEAHRRGGQETLDPGALVEPLVGQVLSRLVIPLRCRIVPGPDGLAIGVPGYVVQALEEHPAVLARIEGGIHPGQIVEAGGRGVLVLDGTSIGELGLGLDDSVDVFLKAEV